MLKASGRPYVIENVPGAPLSWPIRLCGKMFPELRVYRHRMFETSFGVSTPYHPAHDEQQVKMGRPVAQGDFIQVVGNFSGVAYAREAMGIPWMTRDELREAIPPAYTLYIGKRLLSHMRPETVAA
jgi:DNA (cytosine-5)-methyltransferase 1